MLNALPRQQSLFVHLCLVGVVLQKQVLDLLEVEVDGNVQRRVLRVTHSFVGVGPGLQQKLNNVGAAIVHSPAQQGVAVLVVEIDEPAMVNHELLYDLGLVDLDGSSQLLRDLLR